MKLFSNLGKALSKSEQREIYGGSAAFTQFLMCKANPNDLNWTHVETYGNNAECHAVGMPIYCSSCSVWAICRCFGNDTHNTPCCSEA